MLSSLTTWLKSVALFCIQRWSQFLRKIELAFWSINTQTIRNPLIYSNTPKRNIYRLVLLILITFEFFYEKSFQLSHFTRIVLEKIIFSLEFARHRKNVGAHRFISKSLWIRRNTIRGNFKIELRQDDPTHTHTHTHPSEFLTTLYTLW